MSAIQRLNLESFNNQVFEASISQLQTRDAFSFKWAKRDTYDSEVTKKRQHTWLVERYCGGDIANLEEWLTGGKKIILDAGCGAGYSAGIFFGDRLNQHDYLGVDISDSVYTGKQRFLEEGLKGDFIKSNFLDLPVPDESVDIIFSEGVLHHTDNTEESFKHLATKLAKNGYFMFYVYRMKSPVREFTDDMIREAIAGLTDEAAWESLKPLTKLGVALGELDITIDVPEDIPYLGIKKGEINLQRLFYWHICKMYYYKDYSLEEMNHINFDWFRPKNCHRHTPEEVKQWCKNSSLTIKHMDVQESGITVVAQK